MPGNIKVRSFAMNSRSIIIVGGLVLLGAGVAINFPDIVRYIKMRLM
jgi:hypothetical protein